MLSTQAQNEVVEPVEGSRFLVVMVCFSLLAHLVAGGLFLVLPQVARSAPRLPASISVDLVSLAPPGPAAPAAPAKPAQKAAPIKAAPKAEPKPKVEPKPEPRKKAEAPKVLPPKKTAKKKAPENKKSVADALAAIKKQVDNRPETKVSSAIEAIKGQVDSRPEGGAAVAAAQYPGGGAVQVDSVRDLYQVEMSDQIRRQWAYPPAMAKDASILLMEVIITIERDGSVSDITRLLSSGDPGYDDSVIRAIRMSEPLPALPNSFPDSNISFTLRFDSRDLLPWARGNG